MTDAKPAAAYGVLVVGAGVAGTGAAFAASGAGASVLVLDGGPGASALATGAIDFTEDRGPTSEATPPPDVVAFLEAAGGYVLAPGTTLVTVSGSVRTAAGRDASLVDVSVANRSLIGVVDCDRPGWSARTLARAWGYRYEPIETTVLRYMGEHAMVDADFAMRHDDPERIAWLADRLRQALSQRGARLGALVFPPCLGVERARARDLSEKVGIPCGEATGLPGGPAGLRFEATRSRVLAARGVEVIRRRASSVERTKDGSWSVRVDGGAFAARTVVVATGGALGGGLTYRPSNASARAVALVRAESPLRLSLACPLTVGARGQPIEGPSSTFGHPAEELTWPWTRDPLLERAGALVDERGAARIPGLFAAGDVVADAPRTWLRALASGLRAGAAAARAAGSFGP